jgi:cation transport ATPase
MTKRKRQKTKQRKQKRQKTKQRQKEKKRRKKKKKKKKKEKKKKKKKKNAFTGFARRSIHTLLFGRVVNMFSYLGMLRPLYCKDMQRLLISSTW